jgi:protein TonB
MTSAEYQSILDIFPYGAPELKRMMRRYLLCALMVAVCGHLLGFSSYYVVKTLVPEDPPTEYIFRVRPIRLDPPPPISNRSSVPIRVAEPKYKPAFGEPVPIPDVELAEAVDFATQNEINRTSPVVDESGYGELSIDPINFTNDDEPDISKFVPYEIEPKVITRVQPVYPDLARKSNQEGRVTVKALVDKEGKVKKAVVIAGPEIFHEATIAAALQWVFKPAIQHDKPIAVWVALQFQFKLR